MLRRITLGTVLVLLLIGLVFHTGTGTLSSFGWRSIASICPLGAIESFLADRAVFPRALIALVFVIASGALLGKFFCAWLCPIPPLRGLFKRKKKVNPPSSPSSELESIIKSHDFIQDDTDAEQSACPSNCTTCAKKRKGFDSRHIVLGGALFSSAVFGFPVFCLICPVGLVFATIIAFWRWVGFNDLTLSLVVFPAILVIEVFVLRKWCLKFCPLSAVASLMALPNRFFRPKVDSGRCLRSHGVACTVCTDVCDELLDPHSPEGMHECSKCGKCLEHCPARAINMPFNSRASKTIE
jgi:ferredoxin-type protein NapH